MGCGSAFVLIYMSMEIPEELGAGSPHKPPGMPGGGRQPVSF